MSNVLKMLYENHEEVYQLLFDLSKSFEYYCAINKPKSEWDEYDYMMFPIWLRLKELLEK